MTEPALRTGNLTPPASPLVPFVREPPEPGSGRSPADLERDVQRFNARLPTLDFTPPPGTGGNSHADAIEPSSLAEPLIEIARYWSDRLVEVSIEQSQATGNPAYDMLGVAAQAVVNSLDSPEGAVAMALLARSPRSLRNLRQLDETQAAAEILQRSSTKTDGTRVLGEDQLAKFFGVNVNDIKLPEGLIQRNDGRFVAFEVKNEPEVDIGHVIKKFQSITALSQEKGLQLGRLDLFVSADKFKGFFDKMYAIDKGLLTHAGEPVKINGLAVRVIARDLVETK